MKMKKNYTSGNQCERSLTPSRDGLKKDFLTFEPGFVSIVRAVGSISMAEYVFMPSVSCSFSSFGAVFEDSFAFGAEIFRIFNICKTAKS